MISAPLITAPPRGGPSRYGLLETFPPIPFGDPYERLGGRFLSEPCRTVQEYAIDLCPPEQVVKEMVVGFGPETEAIPFGFTSTFGCSRVGMAPAEIEARARRILADGLGPAVEGRWYEHLAAAPTVLATTPQDPACALALLTEALAGVGAGSGVIYAPAPVVTLWSALRALTVEAGRLREVLGSTVVATRAPAPVPTGHPAADPTTRWIYASDGLPEIRLGPVEILAQRDSILDAMNDYQARAEVEGSIAADACLVAAVPVLVCGDALS